MGVPGRRSRWCVAPAAAFGPDGVTDPAWIHLGLEAAKLAMADRDALVTDPDFRDSPVERLTDATYARSLADRIDPRHAARPGPTTNPPGGGTVYLAAVDRQGNAVSLIESNYLGFGSGVVDPATGIHYQNRGSYFSLDAAHPNLLEPAHRRAARVAPPYRDCVGARSAWASRHARCPVRLESWARARNRVGRRGPRQRYRFARGRHRSAGAQGCRTSSDPPARPCDTRRPTRAGRGP